MFRFLKQWMGTSVPEQPKNPSEVKYLITGLGNIGPDYDNTRHNIGFKVLDELAQQKGISFTPARYGDIAQYRHKGRILFLLKPSTYMNLSGKAIQYWLTKENIDIPNLLVITDDVALPLADLRLKTKGGDGGHNGLSSIIATLGTSEFTRLRFGIGNDFPKGGQVNFVLGKWHPEELEIVNPQLKVCASLVDSFVTAGPERTMNQFNTKPGKNNKTTDTPPAINE
jgi:peptidyl-tRNA hydrolase, PTH1 family